MYFFLLLSKKSLFVPSCRQQFNSLSVRYTFFGRIYVLYITSYPHIYQYYNDMLYEVNSKVTFLPSFYKWFQSRNDKSGLIISDHQWWARLSWCWTESVPYLCSADSARWIVGVGGKVQRIPSPVVVLRVHAWHNVEAIVPLLSKLMVKLQVGWNVGFYKISRRRCGPPAVDGGGWAQRLGWQTGGVDLVKVGLLSKIIMIEDV